MRTFRMIGALLAAVAVASCGGGSGGGSLTPGSSAATSGTPTSAASTAASSSTPTGGSVDKALIAAAAGKIATHSSYAVHCESGTTVGDETVVVAGGLRRAAVHLTGAGLTQTDYVWWDVDATHHYRAAAVRADGTFDKETSAADSVGLTFQTACSPGWFWGIFMSTKAIDAAASVGTETKDGIPSTHFSTAGVNAFDLWLASADGTLVAIESSAGAASKLIVQLSRFDDPSITVKVPSS